ncbi:hypothetical protein [Hyphobacterium sp.]|uniref:hypothetical protein n=1 Tax=Hyphobacterium sp. TaxID=2004662 RepID=UPI003B523D21
MAGLILSALASAFLPTGCNQPGWSFCVAMPPDAERTVNLEDGDFVVYDYLMSDGSRAHIFVGRDPVEMAPGRWSERRQGLETVRWQSGENGRIDYYIERVWADAAGIPRWLHMWVLPSEDGATADAEALIASVRSCDERLCPSPGPVDPIQPAEPVGADGELAGGDDSGSEIDRDAASRGEPD